MATQEFDETTGRRALRLAGRVAVVTGSDSGIGRAIAEAFAMEGADVAITYFKDDYGATEAANQVRAQGRRAIEQRLDVRDEESVAELFRRVDLELGTPYILVNNAGTGTRGTPVADMKTADFDNVIKTDLYGPFFCTREFIRRRRDTGGTGKIINITSVHEAIPSPGASSYGAAKGGLLLFTRSVALEAAELRINVNAVAPGLIRTPMTQGRTDDPQTRKEEMPRIPWHRAANPGKLPV